MMFDMTFPTQRLSSLVFMGMVNAGGVGAGAAGAMPTFNSSLAPLKRLAIYFIAATAHFTRAAGLFDT
ncbi:MAG: hypothetical protein A3F78_01340 [Burkholderiales bacterium RIFCSPLOWO2_12_FULL_61_40]|nr:MAG: hypothetical protein A3F78_01340 [Burkholderiales bacterium RIFCSPLOWO2_12_FULL_61_40]